MSAPDAAEPLVVGNVDLPTGARTDIEIRVARLPTGTWVSLPVSVVRGVRRGPSLWLAAALHGDELNGFEIARRVIDAVKPKALHGTLIAVPIVNVFGFLQQDRYLPDRRDLNRSFPGSARGSLAARLAHLFMSEIVAPCQYGIDLHTGSQHRTNLPQIRANLGDTETRRLALAFGAPVTVDAALRAGSLREAAVRRGQRVLVYEAGEVLRFERQAIRVGVEGVLRVMAALGMLQQAPVAPTGPCRVAIETKWIRARRAGILLTEVETGQFVTRGQVVAAVTDTFSRGSDSIRAPFDGLVVGLATNPVVNRGDAIANLAQCEESTEVPLPRAEPSARTDTGHDRARSRRDAD